MLATLATALASLQFSAWPLQVVPQAAYCQKSARWLAGRMSCVALAPRAHLAAEVVGALGVSVCAPHERRPWCAWSRCSARLLDEQHRRRVRV